MKNQCSKLEKQKISILTININICEEVNKDLAIKALISCLISVCILALNEPVKEAMAAPAALGIAQVDFAVSVYWLMNISNALAIIYAIVSSIKSLLKRQEYRKVKNKLSDLVNSTQNKEPEQIPSNSWLAHADRFSDDPFFDEFVEAMAANRRELDAEVNAWLDAEKNRQKDPDDPSN